MPQSAQRAVLHYKLTHARNEVARLRRELDAIDPRAATLHFTWNITFQPIDEQTLCVYLNGAELGNIDIGKDDKGPWFHADGFTSPKLPNTVAHLLNRKIGLPLPEKARP